MYNNVGLVQYVKEKLKEKNIYMMGSFGQYVTNDFITQKAKLNQHNWYISSRIVNLRKLTNQNIRAWDCVGLIKSYYWNDYKQGNASGYSAKTDVSADYMYNIASVKGPISELPVRRIGLAVWMPGHIGVYIGNNIVIECTPNTSYASQSYNNIKMGGICETKLSDRKWTHWLEIPFIEYISDTTDASNNYSGSWVQAADGIRWWYKYDINNNGDEYPHNTWKCINNMWYYFDENGYMKTGWLNDNGKWYYLDESKENAGMMRIGLVVDPDTNYVYYLNKNGELVEDSTITINITSDNSGKIIR